MRKLCDSVDRFCLQHPRFGIPNLMKFLVGIMAVVFVLDLFSNGYASYMLYFNAELVLQGELWRLVTWMFLPTNGSLFWIFISLSFYYFIGTSIDRIARSFRFVHHTDLFGFFRKQPNRRGYATSLVFSGNSSYQKTR